MVVPLDAVVALRAHCLLSLASSRKHYSIRTEQAYIEWIRRLILFHHKRHPDQTVEQEISEFLSHLAVEKNVSASTQNQAFSALLFLYQQAPSKTSFHSIRLMRHKTAFEELQKSFSQGNESLQKLFPSRVATTDSIAELLTEQGFYWMECVRLRVKDVDFGYDQITVRWTGKVKAIAYAAFLLRW